MPRAILKPTVLFASILLASESESSGIAVDSEKYGVTNVFLSPTVSAL